MKTIEKNIEADNTLNFEVNINTDPKVNDCNPHEFSIPFESFLNFENLIKTWEKKSEHSNPLTANTAKNLLKALNQIPLFQSPIKDLSALHEYQDILELLIMPVLPTALDNALPTIMVPPFKMEPFYVNKAFAENINFDDMLSTNMDMDALLHNKKLLACSIILNKLYGVPEFEIDMPVIFNSPDKITGLDRYYKLSVNKDFIDVKNRKSLKPISESDVEKLVNNYDDLDLWLDMIPPENFEFHGFVLFSLIDVTEEDALSSIKDNLLKKDSIACDHSIEDLENKMKILFKHPELRLGIAAFDPDDQIMANFAANLWKGIVFDKKNEFQCEDFQDSIYHDVMKTLKPVVINDLNKLEECTKLEEALKQNQIKSIVIFPLFHADNLIGVLELGSPVAGFFNAFSIPKLDDVVPLFSNAIQRATDELKNQIQTVIKEEYTAIHPTVEWRFRQAAIDLIGKKDREKIKEDKPIVFKDVLPLYGQLDIRNSSVIRNDAIRADLISHLTLVKNVIEELQNHKNLDVFGDYSYRVDSYIDELNAGISTGDEAGILDFVKSEIEPVFEDWKIKSDDIRKAVEVYKSSIDPDLGVYYEKRKAFEKSLTQINEVLSGFIEEEENKIQEACPHYFEKYKTDGVEYNLYVGASLLEDSDKYNDIYLKNFRLWQLKMMAEATKIAFDLAPQLPTELHTTQLILVHSVPLSIRFREDEKQFDVDGAYNIRYEIVKKRIDKAHIKGTDERLTQPKKIAIVYSNTKDAAQYYQYISYLQAKGLLAEEVEDLVLEDLQGVQGLKALRVEVLV